MKTKERFFYMVCGAVFGVTILLIGMAVSPTTAQRDTFGEIICTGLTVVDREGNKRVRLEIDKNDGVIGTWNRHGKIVALMGGREHGGVIGIRNRDGEYIARMFSNNGIGTIQVSDLRVTDKVPYGTEWVRLWAADNGGHVAVYGKNADIAAAYMTARLEGGGIIWVTDQDGDAVATLTSYERGGLIRVRGKDGGDRADMKAGKYGGLVNVYSNHGEGRSTMGVNQSGHGAVATWDKHGEKHGDLK
ncbi:MAG: hypothetical protein OXN17_08790 [Candidatus Poribacteria bacterium]|nr:hypothetical protein [Candidatus Poribacteria bacterium]MDE0502619.1 hypothetical protein [Candidatus Poribacteria bacterium]